METYILVSFWLGVVSIAIRALVISLATYPRKNTTSLGGDLVFLFIGLGFAAWAGWLLWGG